MATRTKALAQAYSPQQYAELAKAYAAPQTKGQTMTDADLEELFSRRNVPVYSAGQGVAEAGGKIAEAYLRRKAREKTAEQQAGDYKSLAQAITGAGAPMSVHQANTAGGYADLAQQAMPQNQTSNAGVDPMQMQPYKMANPDTFNQAPASDNQRLAALMQGVPDRLKLQALPVVQQEIARVKAANQPTMLPAVKPGEVVPQRNPDGSISTAFSAPPLPAKPDFKSPEAEAQAIRIAGAEAKAKADAEAAHDKAPKLPPGMMPKPDGTGIMPMPGSLQEQQMTNEKEKAVKAKAADDAAFTATDSSFQTLIDKAKDIKNNTEGLVAISGPIAGRLPTFGQNNKSLEGDLDVLKSRLTLAAMAQARQGSANGATGFGALSEKELGILENNVAKLDPKIGAANMVKKLDEIIASASGQQNALRTARGKALGRTASIAPAGSDNAQHFEWSPDGGLKPK